MKSVIFSIAIILTAITALAQMDVPAVGFNPRATISEEVGITSITVNYSRPGIKGREGKIWGGVVANGFGTFNFLTNTMSSPWRAGANQATVISFEHDVKVEGSNIKAGSYALFMAMGKDTVTIIFSRQTEAWGSFYYKPEYDVVRVRVKPLPLEKSVEWLKYEFTGHEEGKCVLAMQWERLSVPFTIEVDVNNIVVARLREELTGAKGFLSANNLQASAFCFDKGINMEEALNWAQRAVTGRPFAQSGFDSYQNLAYGYGKLNRLSQADSVMDEGLSIANINQYLGYNKALIAAKRSDRAVKIMLAAKVKYGDVYAVNNGLSYAYAAKGDYTRAIEFASKALEQAGSVQSKTTISANIEKLKAGKDINQ
ncbi:MAG: DUF2911 domain-containing protein [Sphingobacteriales bacterium]|nr:DUF2911 domain-containing protein [Sphingobacteriales bacterium]